MPSEDGLRVLPPSPIEDEQRPLLDNADTQANHGAIDRDSAGQEEDGEDVPIAEEPTTARVMVIMVCMWMGSFWAAMGGFVLYFQERPVTNALSGQIQPL